MTMNVVVLLTLVAFSMLYLLHRATRSVMERYEVDPDDRFGPMLCYPNGPLADDTKELIERAQNAAVPPQRQPDAGSLKQGANPDFAWPAACDSNLDILARAIEMMEGRYSRFGVYCCLVEVAHRLASKQNEQARKALHPAPSEADKALVQELDAAEKPEWNLEVAVHDLYNDIASDIINSSPEYQVAALRHGGYSEERIRALFAKHAA